MSKVKVVEMSTQIILMEELYQVVCIMDSVIVTIDESGNGGTSI